MPSLLVLGATSDIARATALHFGLNGWSITIAGRDMSAVSALADDCSIRTGNPVAALHFDALHSEKHTEFWNALPSCPDAVLCAVGVLGDQKTAQQDTELAEEILCSNFTGLVPVLSMAANAFEQRGSGLIIGISSVAGDRGRASNYLYGSAKAGFTAFLSGLRNRLASKGVRVLTVKPGFVATAMTANISLPPLLTASPDDVARDIFAAVEKKRDILYTKWYWRWIMLIVRLLPECVFKRLSL